MKDLLEPVRMRLNTFTAVKHITCINISIYRSKWRVKHSIFPGIRPFSFTRQAQSVVFLKSYNNFVPAFVYNVETVYA